MGDALTVADVYLFVVLSWTRHVGIERERWAVLEGYFGRIAKRPSVQPAFKAEGLAS
jgi:glutathione S-transferase